MKRIVLLLIVIGHLLNVSSCEIYENAHDVFYKIYISDSLKIVQNLRKNSFSKENVHKRTLDRLFNDLYESANDSSLFQLRNCKNQYEFRQKYYQSDFLKIKNTDTLFIYVKDAWISPYWEAYWNSKSGAGICMEYEKDSLGQYYELGYRVFPINDLIGADVRNLISNWEQFKIYVKSHLSHDNRFDCEWEVTDNEYPILQRIIIKDKEIIENEKIMICDCILTIWEMEHG